MSMAPSGRWRRSRRELRPLVKGLERADSIAFDFHKWLHVPYDAGFFLVRDPVAHQRAFAANAAYLHARAARARGGRDLALRSRRPIFRAAFAR